MPPVPFNESILTHFQEPSVTLITAKYILLQRPTLLLS